MDDRTFSGGPARTLLARYRVAAIWLLHVAAARAYRGGHKAAAASIIEIADAAEREWIGRTGNSQCGLYIGNRNE